MPSKQLYARIVYFPINSYKYAQKQEHGGKLVTTKIVLHYEALKYLKNVQQRFSSVSDIFA